MPNYSHGTKLTQASVEEPPYLSVGTAVSAKYKGAFCEAKITNVNKHVKLRVLFEGGTGTYLIDDTDLKTGSILETGTRIEARHPKKRQQTYVQATVTKILDHSRYTVVFDDGDQSVLRRNSLCLKSGKHFAESETLDQLPLTNPEHFGNPVKVRAIEQLNNSNNSSNNNQAQASINSGSNNNKAQNNHQLLNDKKSSKAKSSSSTTNSSSTTSEDRKSNLSETTTATAKTTNRKRQQQYQDSYNNDNVKKLKKERNSTPNNVGASNGRRGPATKGRKRRDSVNNGVNSKNSLELDDDSIEGSLDSTDADSGENNVKFELIEIGVKLMVQYGKGKVQNVYQAKVNKIETNSAGKIRYFVHYTGWNNRFDEWITRNRILSIVTEKENGSKESRSKQVENVSSNTIAPPAITTTTTSSVSTNPSPTKDKEKEKVKEKDKEKERDKEKEKKKDEDRKKDDEKEKSDAKEKDDEKDKVKEKEKDKDKEKKKDDEKEKAKEKEKEKVKEKERVKQKDEEKEKLKQKDEEREKLKEKEKEKQKEKEKERMKDREKEEDEEKEKHEEIEKDVEMEKDEETEEEKNDVKEKEKEKDKDRDREKNRDRDRLKNSTELDNNSVESSLKSKDANPPIKTDVKQESIKEADHSNNNTVDPLREATVPVAAPAAVASPSSRPVYKFCEEIDESDCDKKISILQERIMALRQTYISLKTELADLDRRRKRPRTERSNTEHINCWSEHTKPAPLGLAPRLL